MHAVEYVLVYFFTNKDYSDSKLINYIHNGSYVNKKQIFQYTPNILLNDFNTSNTK
jgi:hypothetical protein